MSLVDTHCHIQSIDGRSGDEQTVNLWGKLPLNSDQVISAAESAGVEQFICVGCSVSDSQLAVRFCANRPQCFASVGIHPHEAGRHKAKLGALKELDLLAAHPKVVAIGECGLDYFYNHSKKADQQEILLLQLNIAVIANLPVIFHVREAFDDFWPLFDSFKGKIRGVLHSFTDSQDNLKQAIERGLFIGVNGIATFTKNSEQLDMYKAIPLAHLLLETDAPFLTPTPYRGNVNEPKNVSTIAKFLADLRGEDQIELANKSTENARLLFAL